MYKVERTHSISVPLVLVLQFAMFSSSFLVRLSLLAQFVVTAHLYHHSLRLPFWYTPLSLSLSL